MIPKITLMDLYVIETLRKNGLSDQTILEKVRNKEVESFKKYNDRFDFTVLYELEDAGVLADVLKKGYEVKFLTFTGLVNVLKLKFNREEGVDYEAEDFTITNLQLEEEELEVLKQIVSKNWIVSRNRSGVIIEPVEQPPILS
ncbi:MAG TPA: hypothetical protein VK037_01825 [Pseudogracilibacillus sp.]|nr:hypothetical protein [Pseudogracilibacillus sp.]